MDARLLAQLGFVALSDAHAIEDRYAWPPRAPLTAEERVEVADLEDMASAIFDRASAAGWEGGTDAAFAYLLDVYPVHRED